jgi:hypothetical protein
VARLVEVGGLLFERSSDRLCVEGRRGRLGAQVVARVCTPWRAEASVGACCQRIVRFPPAWDALLSAWREQKKLSGPGLR